MDNLKYFIRNINDKSFLEKNDLIVLFDLLNDFFKLDLFSLKFLKSNVYPISYDFCEKSIMVDYERLIQYYLEVVSKTDINNFKLVNYYIVFAFIHEFVHEAQRNYSLDDNVQSVYDLCFKYTCYNFTDNHLVDLIRNVIYNKLHDYFATEINANVVASEFIISLVDIEYKVYFYKELKKYLEKCYLDYDLFNMYKDELGMCFEFSSLDIYNKIRLGMFLSSEERDIFRKDKELVLEKVINCK